MTLFDDELLLRPKFTSDTAVSSENLNFFIDLVQNFYNEDIFSSNNNYFEHIKSIGIDDKIFLDTNTNIDIAGTADLHITGGTQNIFNQSDNFSIRQIKGETNLYLNDVANVNGTIELVSGTLNLLVENHSNQNPKFQIDDNFFYIDDVKQDLFIDVTPNSDASILVYSLNDADIEVTQLRIQSSPENEGTLNPINKNQTDDSLQTKQKLDVETSTENTSVSQLDDFIFNEPDVLIEPSPTIQIDMSDSQFSEIESFIENENEEMDLFLEKVRTEAKMDVTDAGQNGQIPVSKNINVDDLTTISDYDDLVFEDALEILE